MYVVTCILYVSYVLCMLYPELKIKEKCAILVINLIVSLRHILCCYLLMTVGSHLLRCILKLASGDFMSHFLSRISHFRLQSILNPVTFLSLIFLTRTSHFFFLHHNSHLACLQQASVIYINAESLGTGQKV